MTGKAQIVPVFDGVGIDAARCCTFVKDCSIHGSLCSRVDMRHWLSVWAYNDDFYLARRITAACAARTPAEFRELMRTLPDADTIFGGPLRARCEGIAGWLVRTLGRTHEEILASLRRIAGCRRIPPEYGSRTRYDKTFLPVYAAVTGIGAASRFIYPALFALTRSCAEFDALAGVTGELGARLERKLVHFCDRRGVSAWEVASIHTGQFLRVLQKKHRYVLL